MHDTQAMSWQQQRITGRHLAHRSQGLTLTLRAVELYASNRPHPEVGHKSLENFPEKRPRALPCFQWSFRGGF